MKKFGYFLGAVSLVWVAMIGGADFTAPFMKNALIIIAGVVIGIAGLLFSVWLIWRAEQNEREDYLLLIEGRKSSLLRQCRRIKALKR